MKYRIFLDGQLLDERIDPVAGEDLRAGDFVGIDPATGNYVRFGNHTPRVVAIASCDIPKGAPVRLDGSATRAVSA